MGFVVVDLGLDNPRSQKVVPYQDPRLILVRRVMDLLKAESHLLKDAVRFSKFPQEVVGAVDGSLRKMSLFVDLQQLAE